MANTLTELLDLSVTYNNRSSYGVAGGQALLMTPAEFKDLYLWGIPLKNPTTQREPDEDFFLQKLLAAQEEVEHYFDLKLYIQPISETRDFIREEFASFGYVKSSYTISEIYNLKGRLNETQIIDYPKDWLTIKHTTDGMPSRNLNIVPNGASTTTFNYYAVTYTNAFSFGGFSRIPNYWQVHYATGYRTIPKDLIDFICTIAAIKVLPLLEMTITGQTSFGMASQSLSIDGLSQSTSKMNGGNIFQQRMKGLGEQVATMLPRLRSVYTGILFDVC